MVGGVLGEDALAGSEAESSTFAVAHIPENGSNLSSIRRQENLFSRSEKSIQTIPAIGKNRCAACGGLEETYRR